jgi:hypothetical protein
MAIDYQEWNAIDRRIMQLINNSNTPEFTQGEVIKADPDRNLVWLNEIRDQPIPIFGFDYEVKYYDTQADGTVNVRKLRITPVCPQVGDIVLVAKQYGSLRLPKCLGILRSVEFTAVD